MASNEFMIAAEFKIKPKMKCIFMLLGNILEQIIKTNDKNRP